MACLICCQECGVCAAIRLLDPTRQRVYGARHGSARRNRGPAIRSAARYPAEGVFAGAKTAPAAASASTACRDDGPSGSGAEASPPTAHRPPRAASARRPPCGTSKGTPTAHRTLPAPPAEMRPAQTSQRRGHHLKMHEYRPDPTLPGQPSLPSHPRSLPPRPAAATSSSIPSRWNLNSSFMTSSLLGGGHSSTTLRLKMGNHFAKWDTVQVQGGAA